MLVLVKNLPTYDTFLEIKDTPPACVNCKYVKYDEGAWCLRQQNLEVFNVVTGELQNYYRPTRCQDQRYGTHESCCGILGKFFESK